ncbi:esterase-like activity of phytase family protein [Rhodosalinus sediminis]|uniref:Esterase-like activity of phytase family protein n=1 Tax=Rhodosalinus sediminis TaxID=1940533 RepID=A0A3D9BWY5_9RHOB|nr:esterase-like activity of phytase family protein [Rhodosalinus sediminis]REC57881.1 esterase-like activity of phytase family protein [Rhodosalinus sediminis]
MRRRFAAALILACLPASCAPPEGVTFLGRHALALEDPRAGGFSGLELDATGTRLVAVSDRGALLEARLHREGGRIAGLSAVRLSDLPGLPGAGARAPDAEGLARLGERLWISYEGRARVARHRGDTLPRPAAFAAWPENRGPEALAVDGAGRLYTLPEAAEGGAFPLYRFAEGRWRRIGRLPRDGGFVPVGADFDDAGRLYVLERAFVGLGFRSRVRRVRPGDGPLDPETVLPATAPGRHGNLEGLAVWRDGGGRLRLTMIADDNFLAVQRSEIVDYALP